MDILYFLSKLIVNQEIKDVKRWFILGRRIGCPDGTAYQIESPEHSLPGLSNLSDRFQKHQAYEMSFV